MNKATDETTETKTAETTSAEALAAEAAASGESKEKKSTKGKAAAASTGPFVYVGHNDTRKQLKRNTAYLQIPEGEDKTLFIPLDEYPEWKKAQKEASKK